MKLVDILARELKVWPEGCDELFQTSSGRVIGVSNRDTEKSEKIGAFTLNDEGVDPHVTRAEWQAAVDALNAPKVLEWPEGATHKFSEPTTSPWRDLSGATWKWFESGIWRDSGRTSESLMAKQPHRLTKLPIPENEISMPDLVVKWDGEGLPPVNCFCETLDEDANCWVKVEIYAHTELMGETHACAKNGTDMFYGLAREFRAIKTAEQMEEEERERTRKIGVAQMMEHIHFSLPKELWGECEPACYALYEAGYRKK